MFNVEVIKPNDINGSYIVSRNVKFNLILYFMYYSCGQSQTRWLLGSFHSHDGDHSS